MKLFSIDHNNETVRTRRRILLISIILYVFLVVLIAFPKSNHIMFTTPVKGVITQIQTLLLVFVVLRVNKIGFLIAIALNSYSLLLSVIFIFKTNSLDAIPGTISYIGTYFILTLIYIFKRKIGNYIKENDRQRRELLNSENSLRKMAYYDTLTGLSNRDFFMESLAKDLSLSKRNNTMLCVVFIDLDSFKNINDSLGHNAGDKALKEVSKRISSVIRNEDILSRFGGDEFLLKTGNINSIDDVYIIAEKILGVFCDSLIIEDTEFFTKASIGISVYPHDGDNAEQLIKNADMAMYLAKKQGKNRFAFFSDEMREKSIRIFTLTNKLHKAIENNELSVVYQPQLEIGSKKIVGFEALLRWHNSEFEFISPEEFIPIAESTGLIKSIGLWVFREACFQYRNWKDIYHTDFRISINISVEQLKEKNVIDQIKNILFETGVSPTVLELEVTESKAFAESDKIINKLLELQKMGFQIAIDDFGKEYSSLNRIRTFPMNRLKIDMDFIHRITDGDSRDKAIVKTIIQLALNLGVKVIAEGVENDLQYNFLEKELCNEVQGFLFYRGMSPDEIEVILDNKRV